MYFIGRGSHVSPYTKALTAFLTLRKAQNKNAAGLYLEYFYSKFFPLFLTHVFLSST